MDVHTFNSTHSTVPMSVTAFHNHPHLQVEIHPARNLTQKLVMHQIWNDRRFYHSHQTGYRWVTPVFEV